MNLNLEDWKKQKESDAKNICLDVRTAEEYTVGNIEDSINIDFYKSIEFMEFLDKLNKEDNYFVYCRSGKRSDASCQIMKEFGFNNVFNLEGGFLAWSENGYEVNR
ncbi:MAG: rhodanese-like domain-containing protein [Flavobacteriaceae bacterium]